MEYNEAEKAAEENIGRMREGFGSTSQAAAAVTCALLAIAAAVKELAEKK